MGGEVLLYVLSKWGGYLSKANYFTIAKPLEQIDNFIWIPSEYWLSIHWIFPSSWKTRYLSPRLWYDY